MAKFTIWGQGVQQPAMVRFCEIDEVLVSVDADTVRNQLASLLANRWLEGNGDGIIEFRNAANAVIIRITQP